MPFVRKRYRTPRVHILIVGPLAGFSPIWYKFPEIGSPIGVEPRSPQLLYCMDFITFLCNVKGQQRIFPDFTVSFTQVYYGQIMNMKTSNFLPHMVYIIHSRNQESNAIVQSFQKWLIGFSVYFAYISNTLCYGDQCLSNQAIV